MKIKHFIPLLLLAGCCTASAQTTNTLADTDTTNVPDIRFQDVPIAKAIDALAHQAGVNYILDTNIFYQKIGRDAAVTVLWRNITARQALVALLDIYGLQLIENPQTGIALITWKSPDAKALVVQSTPLPVSTNDVTEPIQIDDVPLTTAIENLTRQLQVNYMFDPDCIQIINADPRVSIRWDNISVRKALLAILDKNGLQIIYDPKTRIARITKKNANAH